MKSQKRKAERKWRATGLTIHKDLYKDARNKLNVEIQMSKKCYFQDKISGASSSQGELFKCLNELFNKKRETPLPTHTSTKELCDRMAAFFADKIKTT